MIVKVSSVPPTVVQPLRVPLTVIVATIGTPVLFAADVKAKLPAPDAGKPIAVLLFVQLKTVPAPVFAVKAAATDAPAHTEISVTFATTGVGRTVIVKVIAVAAQPPSFAVTVTTSVMSAPVVFEANVNAGIVFVFVPLPEANPSNAWLLTLQL